MSRPSTVQKVKTALAGKNDSERECSVSTSTSSADQQKGTEKRQTFTTASGFPWQSLNQSWTLDVVVSLSFDVESSSVPWYTSDAGPVGCCRRGSSS
jgi:hypothetical protein